MRLWHYKLLPYLPDRQFKGQLRELVAIMRTWRDKGQTNHLLINKIMDYDKGELCAYYMLYENEYCNRYSKFPEVAYLKEFMEFCDYLPICGKNKAVFSDWHNEEYLRICMANLYEKFYYGVGKSKIAYEAWITLENGYREITGDDYYI